jgi:hypothetical protein
MQRKYLLGFLSTLTSGLLFFNAGIPAAEPAVNPADTQAQEPVYGSQLMSPEERAEHRARMRAATTVEEREKIRKEHHALMQERAKKLGITLPDEPPAPGMGAGPSMGAGGRRGQ